MRSALETHLRHHLRKQVAVASNGCEDCVAAYRLRVDDVRVFYDVSGATVENFGDRDQIGDRGMARTVRKSGMKEVPLSKIKDDLSRFLREAENQEIVITRHGKPAGLLIGFEFEEDWFEYRLENDPRFLRRIEQARRSLQAGRGISLEDLEME